MKEFTVRWEIQVSAESKEQAAIEAQRIQQDQQSEATVFSVCEFDNTNDEFEDFDLLNE